MFILIENLINEIYHLLIVLTVMERM